MEDLAGCNQKIYKQRRTIWWGAAASIGSVNDFASTRSWSGCNWIRGQTWCLHPGRGSKQLGEMADGRMLVLRGLTWFRALASWTGAGGSVPLDGRAPNMEFWSSQQHRILQLPHLSAFLLCRQARNSIAVSCRCPPESQVLEQTPHRRHALEHGFRLDQWQDLQSPTSSNVLPDYSQTSLTANVPSMVSGPWSRKIWRDMPRVRIGHTSTVLPRTGCLCRLACPRVPAAIRFVEGSPSKVTPTSLTRTVRIWCSPSSEPSTIVSEPP